MPGPHRLSILLTLAGLVFGTLPIERVDGAFASAKTEAEFNWALAEYIQCSAVPSRQCWNLVLDPFAVTDVDVTVGFENDAVAVGPEVIFITPSDNYDITSNPIVVNLGNNQSEIQNLSFSLIGEPSPDRVNIFAMQIMVNENFDRPFATFTGQANNVTVQDLDTGIREPVPFDSVIQPEPAVIQVPTPSSCDFDGDQSCDIADLDFMTTAIADGTQNPLLDLNADGVTDLGDLDMWRRTAATRNGLSAPYPNGDANLDGTVNAFDLNRLALHWLENDSRWSSGDFNASGFVDASDLNKVGLSWLSQVPPAAAVPEPQAFFLLLSAIAILAPCRRREHKKA